MVGLATSRCSCRLVLSAAKPNAERGSFPYDTLVTRLFGFSRNKFRDQPNLQKPVRHSRQQPANYPPTSIVTPLPARLNAGTVVVLRFSNAVRAAASCACSLVKLSRWATVGS